MSEKEDKKNKVIDKNRNKKIESKFENDIYDT
jgi:hypothetical protein